MNLVTSMLASFFVLAEKAFPSLLGEITESRGELTKKEWVSVVSAELN